MIQGLIISSSLNSTLHWIF